MPPWHSPPFTRRGLRMKGVPIALLLFSLILPLNLPSRADQAVAQAWRIGLYIPSTDRSIHLGTVDGSCYDIKTGGWCAISDGKRHSVWIFVFSRSKGVLPPVEFAQLSSEAGSALPQRVDYSLVVTARDTGPTRIDDLSDLQISGGGPKGLDRGSYPIPSGYLRRI